jgi:hypothetical protein
VPGLTVSQAGDYVAALAAGDRPASELIGLARPSEPLPRLLISTVTGPVVP